MVLKLVEKVDTQMFMSVVSLPFVGQGKTLWVSVGSDLVNFTARRAGVAPDFCVPATLLSGKSFRSLSVGL